MLAFFFFFVPLLYIFGPPAVRGSGRAVAPKARRQASSGCCVYVPSPQKSWSGPANRRRPAAWPGSFFFFLARFPPFLVYKINRRSKQPRRGLSNGPLSAVPAETRGRPAAASFRYQSGSGSRPTATDANLPRSAGWPDSADQAKALIVRAGRLGGHGGSHVVVHRIFLLVAKI